MQPRFQNLVAKELFTVDPGKSNGCILKYHPADGIELNKMPETFEDLVDYFRYQQEICSVPMIFLEIVSLRKDDTGKKAFRIQKMLNHYSELKSAIKLSGIPWIELHPRTWQTYLRIQIQGEDYDTRKTRFRDIATGWYPLEKVAKWNADALLILRFAQKKLDHDPLWILQNKKEPKNTLFTR